MSDSSTDFYHQKTDAELQFFVDNPDYYQPSLVDAARRELRRRGVAPAGAAAPEATPQHLPEEPAESSSRTGLIALVVAAVLVLSLGTFYFLKTKEKPAPVVVVAKPKAPPKLVEVATSVIPDFGAAVLRSVQTQVQRVPAAERTATAEAGQPMHQYRELAKRFWTAETQAEYVFEEVRNQKITPALPGHVQAAQASWELFNKALLYSYKFGPAMTSHLDLMSRVARQQQEGLADLLIVANNPQPFENEKTKKRTADVSDLLSGLLPKSPVTDKPYNTIVRHVQL